MSLRTNNADNVVKIPLYYKEKKTKYGFVKPVILEEEEAKKMLEDEEQKKDVKILNTTWQLINWKEQNDLYSKATIDNPVSGQKEIDFTKYREYKVDLCLKDWDYMEDGKKVPLTPENIDSMNADVMERVFEKYELAVNMPEDDRGN